MPRSKYRYLVTAAAIFALSGCDRVELFGLYVANLGTEAVVKSPLPIELPFKDLDGRIVVEANVNGSKPVGFLLDTSAPLLSLLNTESTRHLHLDMSGAHRLGSAGSSTVPFGARQDGLEIDFGGILLKNQTVLALSASMLGCSSESEAASAIGGVIGHDIFRRFVVEVDRDRGILRLHDPETYRYRGNGKNVAISFEERQPYIEALITPGGAPSFQARLKLDSGADLEADIATIRTAAPEPTAKDVPASACSLSRSGLYKSGPPVEIRLGDELVYSAANYAARPGDVAPEPGGRLGARFLARFNIVFDYAHERMILEPRATKTLAKGGRANKAAPAVTYSHNAS